MVGVDVALGAGVAMGAFGAGGEAMAGAACATSARMNTRLSKIRRMYIFLPFPIA